MSESFDEGDPEDLMMELLGEQEQEDEEGWSGDDVSEVSTSPSLEAPSLQEPRHLYSC